MTNKFWPTNEKIQKIENFDFSKIWSWMGLDMIYCLENGFKRLRASFKPDLSHFWLVWSHIWKIHFSWKIEKFTIFVILASILHITVQVAKIPQKLWKFFRMKSMDLKLFKNDFQIFWQLLDRVLWASEVKIRTKDFVAFRHSCYFLLFYDS